MFIYIYIYSNNEIEKGGIFGSFLRLYIFLQSHLIQRVIGFKAN